MGNIMSMLNLKNKVNRNGFDLSEKVAFTAKSGELLPILTKEVIPGDKFQINLKWFTRTRPVNTAAYTRMREYYDFFFVPTRLLWKDFQPMITQMTDNSVRADSIKTASTITDRHPYFTVKQVADYVNKLYKSSVDQGFKNNIFGFGRAELTSKLLSYLGYGDFSKYFNDDFDTTVAEKYRSYVNIALNPFPLLSYQKIYQDFYREQQWEKAQPWTYNVDYMKGDNLNIPVQDILNLVVKGTTSMFDLNYCNWNKDLFMGLLPKPQYGAEANVNLDPKIVYGSNAEGYAQQLLIGTGGSQNLYTSKSAGFEVDKNVYLSSNLSILALRQAEFLQKWKEIAQSGQKDYKHQIEKHFGVSVPDCMSDHVEYIGGTVDNIDINEVVNTNITGTNESDIAGKGTGVGNGYIDFEAKEHGILMCIYHNVPLLDYATNGVDKFCQKTFVTDYAIPEMDSVGMQSIDLSQLSNSPDVVKQVIDVQSSPLFSEEVYTQLGYAVRYIDYKTSYDKIRGGFQSTDLSSWCAPISDNYFIEYVKKWVTTVNPELYKYAWMKVNPQVLDTIFGVEVDSTLSTDQFLINSAFDIKAVRNLDVNGLPY